MTEENRKRVKLEFYLDVTSEQEETLLQAYFTGALTQHLYSFLDDPKDLFSQLKALMASESNTLKHVHEIPIPEPQKPKAKPKLKGGILGAKTIQRG